MAKPDMKRSHGLAMGLRMAYWALHRRTDESLARRGVTANQFVLLALLVEEEGITQQDLVLRASSDPSTIRAMLVLLEKKGLIVRNQHTGDGRALSVALTRKGRRVYKQMWTDTQPVRERLSVVLKPEEAILLAELLARITDAMISPPVSKSSYPKKTNAKSDYPVKKGKDEITIPGSWECSQCGFIFGKSNLGSTDQQLVEHCPNDGQILKPETWKARCGRLAATCEQLLIELRRLNNLSRLEHHTPRLDCRKKFRRFE